MTWRKKWTLMLFALAAALYLAWWATAYADPQTLELAVPRSSPRATAAPLAFWPHYRCSKAKDGTTVTLTPLESPAGPLILSCTNCECGAEK